MSPPAASRARRTRPLSVPAETLLTFSRYAPPASASTAPRRAEARPSAPRRPEAFVQANYRFAVSPTHASELDAVIALHDAPVPWDAVDVVFMHRKSHCPICLHNLRCPRVTPCGHTFDLVCILQHLAYSHTRHAKCPLCASPFAAHDLKPVAFRDVAPLAVRACVSMNLVSREKASMIPQLHSARRETCIPDGVTAQSALYARLAFADHRYLLQLVAADMNDLRDVLDEDAALEPFVQVAMQQLRDKQTAVRDRAARCEPPVAQLTPSVEKRKCDLWFFYQATDCQNVFLHPFNHRCLSTQLSADFNSALAQIDGLILQIERHTMDEQLRKRYRFLEHLPNGCEFSFVELDLTHLLSQSTLAVHEAELREREQARKRKQKASAREDKLLAKKRSQSLQNYFNTQGGLRAHTQPLQPVDSKDVTLFPALRVDLNADTVDRSFENDSSNAGFSPPGGAWGGAQISSYSSVTSKMGLFPELGNANSTSETASIPVPLPPTTHGAWGHATSSARSAQSPPEETRRGKRSSGRSTILLSNAGTPHRR